MADTKIVGGRGFAREHEDRDNEVHTDGISIIGDGSKRDPLTAINLRSLPFAAPLVTTTIYANASGSDSTGDGKTPDTAFRTFQKAVTSAPRFNGPGQRTVIDITGLGLEVLPPNYSIPSFQSDLGIIYTSELPDPGANFPFTTACGVDILARPQPASGVEQPTLAGPLIVDPATNLIGIPTNQNYAQDSLKGLFMQSPTGLAGVIWHNSAGPNSTIWVTHSSVPDQPATPEFNSPPPIGAPPFLTGPFTIVEPSAQFQTNKLSTDILSASFLVPDCCSLGIRGIKLQENPDGPDIQTFNNQVWGGRTVQFEMCDMDGFGAFCTTGTHSFFNSLIRNRVFVTEAPIVFHQGMFLNVPSIITAWCVATCFEAVGMVADGCGPIGPRLNAVCPVGRGPLMACQCIRNGVIMNTVPDLEFGLIANPANIPYPFVPVPPNPGLAPGLQIPGIGFLFGGGKGILDHVKIFGCASDAIRANAGGGFLELRSVTGGLGGTVFTDLTDTPNAGFGLLLTDGAFALVSDQQPTPTSIVTDVTGSSGPIQVGDAPGGLTSAWAAFHASKQLFDITAVSAAGAVGSGSRLFEKP